MCCVMLCVQLVSMALEGVESESAAWKRLAGFMRSVCAAHPQWREISSTPLLLQLLSEVCMLCVCVCVCVCVRDSVMVVAIGDIDQVPLPSSDSLTSREELPKAGSLLCQILSSPTPNKLLDLVLALLKATPSSEHGALATKVREEGPASIILVPIMVPLHDSQYFFQ